MKKFTLFCLALCAMAFCALPVRAYEVIDNIRYWLHDDDLTAEVGNGGDYSNYFYEGPSTTKLSIPSQVTFEGKTYTVTRITSYLRLNKGISVDEIVLPGTITKIDKYAFGNLFDKSPSEGFKPVKSINIPANIESFDERIFCIRSVDGIYNEYIEHLTIESPLVLKYYSDAWKSGGTYPAAADNTVWHSMDVREVTLLGDAGDTIPENAFKNWDYLKEVTLPKYNTQYIGRSAFVGCTALQSINLSELKILKKIDDLAFDGCTSLVNGDLPESVTDLGYGIFQGCKILKHATLPSTCTAVPDHMYSDCQGSLTIVFPKSITKIGRDAFRKAKLYDFSLPSKVEEIGQQAFEDAVIVLSQNDLVLPKSLVSLGYRAFFKSSGYYYLTINSQFSEFGGSAFDGTEIRTITINNGSILTGGMVNRASTAFGNGVQKYIINSGDAIPDYYFSSCSGLEEIDFSMASIQSIGEKAFEYCTSLKSISTEDAKTIGNSAFKGCTSLTDVDLISITNIPYYTFYGCSSLKNIYLGHVQTISDDAFVGCNAIAAFSAFDATYFNTEGGILYNSDKTRLFLFPRASENFALDDYELPASVTSIDCNAFDYCTHLHSITSTAATPPTIVRKTDRRLFEEGIERLIKIYVPESSIADYKTAWGTSHCEYYALQSGTCTVDDITYEFQANLTATVINGATPYSGDVVIPATFTYGGKTYQVTAIGDDAFDNCTGLTSIVLPEGLLRVGNAFGGCVGLTTLTLPSTLTSLGAWAFYHCTGLTEIICKALNPPTCDEKYGMMAFEEVPTTTPLWVPKASVNLYKEATRWKRFKNNTYAFAATCADVNTIDGNSKAFLKPVSVAFVSGRYVYIQDETGTTMLYLNAADEAIYAGAKITGIEGTTTIYYGLPEVKPANAVSDWTITADGEEPYYQTVTAVPTYDIINQWVKIENVSIEAEFVSSKSTEINLPMANGEIILRNQFRLEYSFSAEKRYDLLAAVAINNDVMKLYFIQVLSEYDKPQGLDNVQSDKVQCTKVLRDGQIFIIRDGKTYTVTGQAVK